MSEHDDNPNGPDDPVETSDMAADQPAAQPAAQPADQPAARPAADPPAAATFDAPAPVARDRWRDRTFRMRSIAAVAVAGLIIGAAGGAVTTALVSDDDRGRGEHRIGQQMQPGMPMAPGGGRQRFGMPGEGGQDSELPELPEMPVPPGSESDGTDEQSSLSQS